MRIKKLIAGLMTSAMVLGMSFATFAAGGTVSIDSKIAADAKNVEVNVYGTDVNFQSFGLDILYDADVLTYDTSSNSAIRSTLRAMDREEAISIQINTTEAGKIRVAGGSSSEVKAEGKKLAMPLKFTVNDGKTKEDVVAALKKLNLSVDLLRDNTGADVATEENPVAVVMPEDGIVDEGATTTTTPDPSNTTTPDPSNTATTTPGTNNTTTPGTNNTTTPGTNNTTTPGTNKTTAPAAGTTNTAPPTGDMSNVVVPMVALCAAAAAIVVVSKKRVNE